MELIIRPDSGGSTRRALGTLEPVTYFEHHITGEIAIPPTDEMAQAVKKVMESRGFNYREACSLHEIDALQKKITEFEHRKADQLKEADEERYKRLKGSAYHRLIDRMTSSRTSPFERDFIRNYLMAKEAKRAKWVKQFDLWQTAHFTLRENDNLHRVKDAVDSVPDMAQEACKKCGKYRALRGSDLCFKCQYDC